MVRFARLSSFVVAALAASAALAADLSVETVVADLAHPFGVAVQPETGAAFVSESGAGRVVRVADGRVEPVVVGSQLSPFDADAALNLGPLGLTFLDRDALIVGDGGYGDGGDLLRIFEIPAPGQPARSHAEPRSKVGPLAAAGALRAEGKFSTLTLQGSTLFVASGAAGSQGWVAKVETRGGKFGELQRFIATREALQLDSPGALAVGSRGELVVGQRGRRDAPGDSRLAFFGATTGKLLLDEPLGLHDVVALAYSPRSRQLYALDAAWSRPQDAGLFQLVAGRRDDRPTIVARKIAALDRPTAMAFAPDGALYVTVLGKPAEDAARTGRLLKFSL